MESPTHHLDTIDPDPIEPATGDELQDTTRRSTWALVGSGIGGFAALLAAGFGLWWLITVVIDAIGSGFDAAAEAARPLAGTIAGPVRRLINDQADQLPVSANTLWWALIAVAVALFTLAVLGSHGARIGWAAIGAITTALVWIAHTPDSRVLAAAITAGAWAALAVFAFNRFTTPEPTPKVVVLRPDPSRDDDQAV